MTDFYDDFLNEEECGEPGGMIVKSIDLSIKLTDIQLIHLLRNKPFLEIQELFNKQIKNENYEGAHQMKRVIRLLNSKVCPYHLHKPLNLKVN